MGKEMYGWNRERGLALRKHFGQPDMKPEIVGGGGKGYELVEVR